MKLYRKILILLAILCAFPYKSLSFAISVPYAIIGKETTLLSSDLTPLTSLPENYFVAVVGDGEVYLEVSYLDITGFILKSSVTQVDYEPKYKYHESALVSLSNDGHEVNVRSAPDHTADNVIAVFPSGERLFYYGVMQGTSQVKEVGNDWYFVRFYDSNGEVNRGYVYSLYCSADPIPENTIEPANPPKDENDVSVTKPETLILPVSKEVVIIIALCVPVVIITFLLFHKRGNDANDS